MDKFLSLVSKSARGTLMPIVALPCIHIGFKLHIRKVIKAVKHLIFKVDSCA